MYRLLLKILLMISMFTLVSAHTLGPHEVLEHATLRCVQAIVVQKDEIEEDIKVLYGIVDENISPIIDYKLISQWVSDRNAWKKASNKTKDELQTQLRFIFNKTYSKYLLEHYHNDIKYLEPELNKNDKRTFVYGIVSLPDNKVYKLNYRMQNSDDGWKISDISFQGISVVKGYRAQFSDTIKKEGLDGLVSKLIEMNKS